MSLPLCVCVCFMSLTSVGCLRTSKQSIPLVCNMAECVYVCALEQETSY